MLESLNESISGSDSSSDGGESTDSPPNPLATLLKKQATLASPDDVDDPQSSVTKGPGKAPLIWFTSPLLPPSTSLGVYHGLFSTTEQVDASYLTALHSKQLSTYAKEKIPHLFLCMIGGGHFAAMIVSLAPKISKRHAVSVDERQIAVIAHKTFHRYTTRRKQGGAQSANDTAKGFANSAGAQIRRYNEQALAAEIRELLNGWKEYLDTAELLFVRATGTANRRTLFGEGAPMRNNDPRVRGFPFTTRRATQSELMRCFVELTRMKISRIDASALAALDSKPAEIPAITPAKPAPSKLTKEEEAAILHSSQLTTLIRRSKAPAVLSYLSANSLSPDYTFTPPNAHTPTILHLAASSNSPPVVLALLTKSRANPTLTTPLQPKPAFELSGDRATRDAFRLARAELGEIAWDWAAASVPAPLTKAEVASREQREKESESKEEKDRREKEVQRLKLEEAEHNAASKPQAGRGGRNLGANVLMVLGRREEDERGLTQEGRIKLERERRARAAEERIKRLQAQ